MSQPIDMTGIAGALFAALSDEQLDALARRVATRNVQPALLDRTQAAKYLGLSPEALRKNPRVRPIYLPECTKPLYRVADLNRLIEHANKNVGIY